MRVDIVCDTKAERKILEKNFKKVFKSLASPNTAFVQRGDAMKHFCKKAK